MSNESIRTFSGLTFFHRDTDLAENLISKYSVGQILTERGFIDLSCKHGGLTGNLRYLIASKNAKDLSAFNFGGPQFGHVLLPPGTFFKVLDIYQIGEKVQICLLELPEAGVDASGILSAKAEEELKSKARESFDIENNSKPDTELQAKEWKERTAFPIGMSSQGEFFDVPKSRAESARSREKKPWWKSLYRFWVKG